MSQEKLSMRFLFGDRELLLAVTELLAAPVEVIVSPAEGSLQHRAGLARQIRDEAGNRLQDESEQLIREYGRIDPGMAVYTSAGDLQFKAVIHAVSPALGEGDEQRKLEQAVSRSLQLCEMNEWHSIGLPMLGADESALPVEMCAQAFFRAITRFWDARHECPVEKVIISLQQEQFRPFFDAFREQGFGPETGDEELASDNTDGIIGEIDLSDLDVSDMDDTDINDWFK